MCTAITLQSRGAGMFFGRTMDFSFDIEPSVYLIRPNYVWNSDPNSNPITDYYGFIAIGQEIEGLLAFFDGVNERGFAAAALYFAGYAQYNTAAEHGREPIASFDFLHYILGQCGSVEDLERLIGQVSIIGAADPVTRTIAPLHWIAADKSGKCVVVEQTEQGLRLFQNPIGVLANSPDFPWHLTNLRNYMNASPEQKEAVQWGKIPLSPFGQGAGTSPLPGGYTSPERFARTSYLKTHIVVPKSQTETVVSCFHIMESVSIPKGAVITGRNTFDYTKYTAFMNLDTCEYFFRTYDNAQITTAGLWNHYENSSKPIRLGRIERPMTFQKL